MQKAPRIRQVTLCSKYDLVVTLLLCSVAQGLEFQLPQGSVPSSKAKQHTGRACSLTCLQGLGVGTEKVYKFSLPTPTQRAASASAEDVVSTFHSQNTLSVNFIAIWSGHWGKRCAVA